MFKDDGIHRLTQWFGVSFTCVCGLLPPANEVWGKVMFLLASAILFTGKVLFLGGSTSRGGLHPGGLHQGGRLGILPWVCLRGGGGLHPGGVRQTPSEIHGIPRDTVNKRAVGILLECFLAKNIKRLNS